MQTFRNFIFTVYLLVLLGLFLISVLNALQGGLLKFPTPLFIIVVFIGFTFIDSTRKLITGR